MMMAAVCLVFAVFAAIYAIGWMMSWLGDAPYPSQRALSGAAIAAIAAFAAGCQPPLIVGAAVATFFFFFDDEEGETDE